MPYRLCPVCQSQGRWLESSSQDSYVSYYRCDKCGTVWAYDPITVYERIRVVTKREPLHPDFKVGHASELEGSDTRAAGRGDVKTEDEPRRG